MSNFCFGCMEPIEEGRTCSCGFDNASYQTAPHQLIPGTLLRDRYQVGKVLGEGGFGITYVGRDNVLDMKIAIKEFYMTGYVNRNNTFSPDIQVSIGEHAEQFEKNRDKFLQEARVLAKFATERGIVGIHDFFEENNTAYIIMDFLTGKTLKAYLKEEKKLSWQKTLELFEPVIKSLQVVHKQGIIHRDISPDNIMLTDNGDVNLLDFGAARQVSDTDIKSLSVILKPGFAPEEQYRSKGQQGPWTDVYALSATMYCCITGYVPDDSMERMFEDKLKSPHDLEPSCSVAISNVLMKGMAVRQNDRYQSIAELAQALDQAAADPDNALLGAPAAVKAASTDSIGAPEQTSEPKLASDPNATVYAEELGKPAAAPTPAPAPTPVVEAKPVEAKPAPEVKPTPAPTPVVEAKPAPQAVPQPQVVVKPVQPAAPQVNVKPVQPAAPQVNVQPVQSAPQQNQPQQNQPHLAPNPARPVQPQGHPIPAKQVQPVQRHAPQQKTAYEQAVADAKVRQAYQAGGNGQYPQPPKKNNSVIAIIVGIVIVILLLIFLFI